MSSFVFLRELLISGIKRLLQDKRLERIVIPCSFGNHGRIGEKKFHKTAAENSLEYLLYRELEAHFATEPRVRFHVTRAKFIKVQAYNFPLRFTHGDDAKYGGGIGGISVPLRKFVHRVNTVERFYAHHVGHFHQVFDGGDFVVNGSLIGATEYSMNNGFEYQDPAQVVYLLDSKRGKRHLTPLYVEEKRSAA